MKWGNPVLDYYRLILRLTFLGPAEQQTIYKQSSEINRQIGADKKPLVYRVPGNRNLLYIYQFYFIYVVFSMN